MDSELFKRERAEMELQLTAADACKSVNEHNPLAVAKEIGNMVEVLKSARMEIATYMSEIGGESINPTLQQIALVLSNIKREDCEACHSIDYGGTKYRGQSICFKCVKDWQKLDKILGRQATFKEFLDPTKIGLKKLMGGER